MGVVVIFNEVSVTGVCSLKVGDIGNGPCVRSLLMMLVVAVAAVSTVIGLHGDETFVEGGGLQFVADEAVEFRLEGSIRDVGPLAAGVFNFEIGEPVVLENCQQCEQQAVAGLTARFGAGGAPVRCVR